MQGGDSDRFGLTQDELEDRMKKIIDFPLNGMHSICSFAEHCLALEWHSSPELTQSLSPLNCNSHCK